MNSLKKSKLFIILLLISIVSLISTYVFSAYEINETITQELLNISKKSSILHTIRNILKILSVFFFILVIANIDQLKESRNLKFILILGIIGLLTNFFIGRAYFSEEAISNLYSDFNTSDFCYLYHGELLTFRFQENNQNIILICEKGKLENNRIKKSTHSILSVLLKDYNLDPLLYEQLVNSNVSSDYIKFETNPVKTNFEKSILDDSYDFIRITFDESLLGSLSATNTESQVIE